MNSSAQSEISPQVIEECWTEVEGCKVRYLKAGSGPAMLLIHGLLAYSYSWRFNLPFLAQHRTVIAPDLPGVGFSGRPMDLDCRLRAAAKRMLKFLDNVDIQRVDLLGTSHGGGIAVEMAAMAPARIRSLVLVAPINPWSPHGRMWTQVLGSTLGSASFRHIAPWLTPIHDLVLTRMYGDRNRIAPGTLESYAKPLQSPGTIEILLRLVSTWNQDLDLLEAAYKQIVEIPALLIWGTKDRAVFPRSARELRTRMKRSELVFFEGVGHLPYEETPEEFNRTVVDFLLRQ